MLHKCKVFELVDRPQDRKVIKNRWVFNIKSDGHKKARLVAKGFSQVEGLDFDQVFSPVVCFETVCLMLALATLENWYITRLDIRSAYLYGKLNEEIYMEQPEGFAAPGQECKVLRLWHALYGLKQASLAWWCTLDESLKELGFERLKSKVGIFFYKKKGTNMVIGIIYVDDALFCGPNKAVVDSMKVQFMRKWECRDLRVQKTLAYSSTETEYMALSDCACQVTWIQSLLGELGYKLNAIPICGDNQGSIFMASNPVMEPRSKHIDIHYHRIRESIAIGKVKLFFIDGAENPTDLLTKNLPHKKFTKFQAQLGLQFPSGNS